MRREMGQRRCGSRWAMWVAGVCVCAAVCAWSGGAAGQGGEAADVNGLPEGAVGVKIAVDDRNPDAYLVRRADGGYEYRMQSESGAWDRVLTPVEFAQLTAARQEGHGWWAVVFNTSEPFGFVWVALGLVGQVVFMGRMVVQWLVSERAGRSVVPAAFWWMSVAGASMLLVYFVWRRDVVGILGQGAGWLIYLRNLWLIHRPKAVGAKVGEEDVVVG